MNFGNRSFLKITADRSRRNRVDHIFHWKENTYLWISRFYKSVVPSRGDLTLSEILTVNLSSYSLQPEQSSHYDNFIRAHKVARILNKNTFYKEASLRQHLAIEHFFKHLYLKTSIAFELKYGTPFQPRVIKPMFSHRIKLILTEISRVSSDVRLLPEVLSLSAKLDDFDSKFGDWAAARYSDPSMSAAEHQINYLDLKYEIFKLNTALKARGVVR